MLVAISSYLLDVPSLCLCSCVLLCGAPCPCGLTCSGLVPSYVHLPIPSRGTSFSYREIPTPALIRTTSLIATLYVLHPNLKINANTNLWYSTTRIMPPYRFSISHMLVLEPHPPVMCDPDPNCEPHAEVYNISSTVLYPPALV